jgi:hypothetical protein
VDAPILVLANDTTVVPGIADDREGAAELVLMLGVSAGQIYEQLA